MSFEREMGEDASDARGFRRLVLRHSASVMQEKVETLVRFRLVERRIHRQGLEAAFP
jgi:hypothetical protein